MQKRGTTTAAAKRSAAKGKRSGGRKGYRGALMEGLESRQLLTTLFGGGAGAARTYLFATDGATVPNAQITLFGNVTAEFIFMHGPTEEIVNRTVTGNTLGLNIFSDQPTTPTGSDIFAIYVSQSDINSYIAIEAIGTSEPFGGIGQMNVIPANPDGTRITASSGSGGLNLGALRSSNVTPQAIIKTDINGAAIGVRPAGLDDLPEDPNADLSAGLRVANGNDLGKFLFDGKVMGKVRIDGSMNTFYAGWLITGDARGASESVGTAGLPISLADNFITPEDIAAGAPGHIVPRQNFYVGGDIQNILSDGAIGWDATFGTASPEHAPFFLSGVDIYVRGRIGWVHGNEGNTAAVTALNLDPAVAGFTRPTVYQEEAEGWWHQPGAGVQGDFFSNGGFPNSSGSLFSGGVLRGARIARDVVPFQNDTFNSFQLLNSFNSRNGNDIIDVLGALFPNAGGGDEDEVDYYGVSLMAGQSVRAQVLSLGGNAHVGVFDPDGRLIASSYSNLTTPIGGTGATSGYSYQLPLEFKADRPGIYRIAVGEIGDVDFTGNPSRLGLELYELRLTNVGNMGIGGVSAANQKTGPAGVDAGPARILDIHVGQHQVYVANGDMGAVWGTDAYNMAQLRLFTPTSAPPPGQLNPAVAFGSIHVANGNLRTIDVGRLGVGTDGEHTTGAGIDLNVPNGSVGLVQTRTAGTVMDLNPSIVFNFGESFFGGNNGGLGVPPAPTSPGQFSPARLAIGGDYQVINAASRFTGAVVADRGMGVMRAAAIEGVVQNITYIYLDADNQGLDGKSDLIDIAGSIDGPVLHHGPGGNFRYMRVGGTVGIDSFFGATIFPRVVHDYGVTASFNDDSGTTINLTPVGLPVPNPNYDPTNPQTGPALIRPQLSTLTYPVRSGGVIVMDVQSTGSLAINSVGGAFNSTAEVSRVEVHGAGAAPVRRTRGVGSRQTLTIEPAFTNQALRNELSVTINGSAVTDVAYIVGMVPEAAGNFYVSTNPPTLRSNETAFGNLTLVANNTGGEIVEVHAATLGVLRSTGTIGLAKSSIAGNSINFINPLALGTAYAARGVTDDMPIQPAGDVVGSAFPYNLQTYGIAVPGDIAIIQANRGLGNIVTNGIIGRIVADADARNVANVSEGIEGPIVARGTTVGGGVFVGTPDGSILAIDIGEGVGSAGSGDFARTGIFAANDIGTIVGNRGANIRGTLFWGHQLGSLTLNNGSLIEANLIQSDFAAVGAARESSLPSSVGFVSPGGIELNTGSITINGNGGIIGTVIVSLTIGSISVPNGFGIISSSIDSTFGGFINNITAGGYGIRDTVINGGTRIGAINVLGNGQNKSTRTVSAAVRQSEFVRADPELSFGFDPFSGRALTPLNDIHSALGTSQATPTIKGVTSTGVLENSRITSQRSIGSITAQIIRGNLTAAGQPYMRIASGNEIGRIQTRGLISNAEIVAGGIGQFLPASDVLGLTMTVSGPINDLNIKGTLGRGSVVQAIGPNGRIGNVSINRDLNGTIRAVQTIGTIAVGRNLNGSVKVDALQTGGLALRKLTVGGTMANGSLEVGLPRNRGSVGDVIIRKGLGRANSNDRIVVGGSINRLQVGGVLNMSVQAANIGTLQASRINSSIRVGNELKNLIVKNGGLHGDVRASRLTNATIAGGITSDLVANNGFGNVTVTRGNVASSASLTSDFGGLERLRVQRGSLFGDVRVARQIGDIVVSGDLGDGVDTEVTGARLRLLQVGGSIKSNTSVRIRGPIDALVVGGDIESGALVQATKLGRQDIDGDVFGSVVIG